MGTINASVFLTLDGVMEAPHVWHPPYVSEASMELLADQMNGATAMLLGRRAYTDFAGYWPHQPNDVPLAEATNAIRKYVVSATLPAAEWNNTTVLAGGLADAVRTLRAREGDVLVPGGARLVRGLLREDLLDELRITLDPVVFGAGARLFDAVTTSTGLDLVDCRRLPHGVLVLVYRPLRGGATA